MNIESSINSLTCEKWIF